MAGLPVPAKIPLASVSSIGASVSTVTLAVANEARTQISIFNNSSANLFVKLGTAASVGSFSIKIAAGGYYELTSGGPIYTGVITGVWDLVNGACLITEY